MTLLELLQTTPKARERKYKNRAVAKILQSRFHNLSDIPLDKLESIVKATNSLDREWRDILLNNPSLRGSDYKDKTILAQKKQVELGYGGVLQLTKPWDGTTH